MANYCSNELHIVWRAEIFEGTPYEVVDGKFVTHPEYEFKFEDFLPFEWEEEGEARRRDESEQYGCVGWAYHPSVFTLEVEEIPEEIWGKLVHFIASYDTRWSPSVEFAKRIYEKWVKVDPNVSVTLYYDEPGQVYSGYVHNGKDYPDDDIYNFYCESLEAYVFPTNKIEMPGKMHFLHGNYNIYSAEDAIELIVQNALEGKQTYSPYDEIMDCLEMIFPNVEKNHDASMMLWDLEAMDSYFKDGNKHWVKMFMKNFYHCYKTLLAFWGKLPVFKVYRDREDDPE